MSTMKFSEVGRHPLLRPESIDGVLTYFPERVNEYPLAKWMPLTNVNSDKVKMDVTKARRGGMTPLVSVDSESPIRGGFGRGEIEFEAAEWREKAVLSEKDLVKLRKVGSLSELESARRIMQRKFAVLEERLLNRLEWSRRQVLYDGQVTATDTNDVDLNVSYEHPGYLETTLTGTDMWTDTSASNPIADLQSLVEDYVTDTGFQPGAVVLPHGALTLLTQNQKFRDIMTNSFGAFQGDKSDVMNHLGRMAGLSGGMLMENSSKISFETELTSAAANGDNSVDLLDVDGLEAGDDIYINSHVDMFKEKKSVSSISGNTVTIGSGISRTNGYSAGDSVKWMKFIFPEDKVTVFGAPDGPITNVGAEGEPDSEFLNTWADVASTLSRRNNFDNPQPGLFTQNIDKMNNDPPHIEKVIGIRALPRVHYNEGWAFLDYKGN